MYNCDFCNEPSKPCDRLNRIVTAYKKRDYKVEQRVSFGYEIVTEANACGACAVKYAAPVPTYDASELPPPVVPASKWKDSVPAVVD